MFYTHHPTILFYVTINHHIVIISDRMRKENAGIRQGYDADIYSIIIIIFYLFFFFYKDTTSR